MKPRLLDLFCGAGGAAMGYSRAGFKVVGVDIKAQANYPFEFVPADALEYLRRFVGPLSWTFDFDAIHASPPCQRFSVATKAAHRGAHADLVTPIRDLLEKTGLPYVIENVPGAPLRNPTKLCGSSLGLDVRRHRLFETNWTLLGPPCAHGLQTPRFSPLRTGRTTLASVIGVFGGGRGASHTIAEARRAMGIDWMTTDELNDAIPPAYTELIGHQLMQHVRARTAA